MESGKLSSRVIIEQAALGANSPTGQRTVTAWTPIAAIPDGVYANITGLSGEMVYYAKSFAPTVNHVVTIRYSTAFTVNPSIHRINYGGRIFAINAVIDQKNTRRFLTIFCTENFRTA